MAISRLSALLHIFLLLYQAVYFANAYQIHCARRHWNSLLQSSAASTEVQSHSPKLLQATLAPYEGPISRRETDKRILKHFNAEFPFFFPGQGSQYVGMGVATANEIPAAKELYSKASSILGYDLLSVCEKGPKAVLDATDVAQPAIFVCSMAAVEKLRATKGNEEAMKATVSLGLSLGEYSALCYADAISFEDAVLITKERGAAMQAASDNVRSSMVAVLGLTADKVKDLCDRSAEISSEPIQIANFLCKGNYVVSGSTAACEALERIAKPQFKALKTIRLPVAGAFHTAFMESAVPRLHKVLDGITVHKPRIPIISNVDAEAHTDPARIRELLVEQVTSPVLWENSVKSVLENGFNEGYELGPGTTLSGILKRLDSTKYLLSIV
ncbi:acyl transferase domain-containing protein, S-malonyltransferase [Cardiosporidium cionae]|uniref:Acyl transferase domain-containing protein, S-malonyltransferase n=1 Tax=Cardiosporidium cionae TaxID=476202 RepID=A0ABQ7JFZ9_9APIC|nr:acyl transferase domain-containing protein, S-malonyltransferase [Cardiosporidium cionae]|eukprot:KAF8822909.1 acyl transferase domain-containing protein, S-malonyltransferase [Cardiosporidium cionae]